MFEEYKYIYLTCNFISGSNEHRPKRYAKEHLCKIAYRILFHGLESISDEQLSKVKDQTEVSYLREVYFSLTNAANSYAINSKNRTVSVTKSIYLEDLESHFEYEMFYYPFDGHNVRLGHYYRHLYQTASFIVNSEILHDRKSKYRYLKLLRAQLSNHEQALLYYNGLTEYGDTWIRESFFDDYRMIKIFLST